MIAQKIVPSRLYLSTKKNLTLPEIPAFAETVIPIMSEARLLGLGITGALEFIYEGSDGTPETQFDLTIAIPIQAMQAASSQFQYLSTQSFPCVFLEYQGSIHDIGAAWHAFFALVLKADLILTGQCREVYLQHSLDLRSAGNITELQIGIAESV
jgi:effector-binding domain-containing protein